MNNKSKIIKKTVEVGGNTLELEVGRFADQADGAVLGRYGDSMILATVVSGGNRPELGYFPLYVEYQEKLYAGGRIKGSRWVKREGRPSDEAILNARLVDRSIRPLFPKEFISETQVILTVLSVDAENDPDVLAINTASAALAVSQIPWNGPISAARIGFISKDKNNNSKPEKEKTQNKNSKTGNFMVNPAYVGREYSELDLVVSSTKDNIIMVEAGANEVPESTLLKAFEVAVSENQKVISTIQELTKEIGKTKQPIIKKEKDKNIVKVVDKYAKQAITELINPKIKKKKQLKVDELTELISSEHLEYSKADIKEIIFELMKKAIRKKVISSGKRIDSRKSDEIRKIEIEAGVLPRTHGSAMFKRGETQALTITTLAAPSLEQWIETMEGEGTKRYMHHYYMPPFSVGETGRLGWPSRREIGHGALAERSLEPTIPIEEDFPYTIRVVSEIFSSNGSTSMASVCGSTLSLMDAGVPLKKPVAGIAMGLITDGKNKKKYAILSDIQGIEDHVGDMDFKVAGTRDGITALQMDVKIDGISQDILTEALQQARLGRIHILDEMIAILPAPRAQLSRFAPKVEVIKIAQDQIGDVIGPGGKIIRQIMADTGVTIDIDDDGSVTVSGTDADSLQKAIDWINNLTRKVEAGEEFEGTVKRIESFGAFIEILPGKDGLLHVSKMSSQYVTDPRQIVSIGDKIKVKVAEIDDLGRINLSVPGVNKPQHKPDNRNYNKDKGIKKHRPRGRGYRR
jgi:polyribonucleotide nucleotidyltransferase